MIKLNKDGTFTDLMNISASLRSLNNPDYAPYTIELSPFNISFNQTGILETDNQIIKGLITLVYKPGRYYLEAEGFQKYLNLFERYIYTPQSALQQIFDEFMAYCEPKSLLVKGAFSFQKHSVQQTLTIDSEDLKQINESESSS